MKNSVEIMDERAKLVTRCKELVELVKTEKREMTEDEQKEFDEAKEKCEALNEELKALEAKLKEYEEGTPKDNETCGCGCGDNENEDRNKNNGKKMEKRQFSLIKAIRSVVDNTKLDEVSQAVSDAGKEQMRASGLSAMGQIQLPTLEDRAAITVTTEHDDVVETDFTNILMPLRSKNVLAQAGCRWLSGLVGDVQVPVMSASQVNWEGETASAQDAGQTFTNIKLQPKRLSAYICISKQMLAQDSIGVENAVRTDLINAINSKLEATILGTADSDSGKRPAGLGYNITATEIEDFEDVCSLEADVEDANIYGEMKYIVSPKAKAALRGMVKGQNAGAGMVYVNDTVDGTSAVSTTHIATSYLYYGDWSNVAIGSWGALDLVVDPYTMAADGQIKLVVNAFFDCKKLRDNAIQYAHV